MRKNDIKQNTARTKTRDVYEGTRKDKIKRAFGRVALCVGTSAIIAANLIPITQGNPITGVDGPKWCKDCLRTPYQIAANEAQKIERSKLFRTDETATLELVGKCSEPVKK